MLQVFSGFEDLVWGVWGVRACEGLFRGFQGILGSFGVFQGRLGSFRCLRLLLFLLFCCCGGGGGVQGLRGLSA